MVELACRPMAKEAGFLMMASTDDHGISRTVTKYNHKKEKHEVGRSIEHPKGFAEKN